MRSSRTRGGLLGLLAAAVLATASTAALTLAEDPVALPVPEPTPTAPARGALLPPPDAGDAVPTREGIEAQVAQALASPALGGRLAVSVVDAETGEAVYERAADEPLLPASTAKIATAVAALTALPPDQRLRTRVVAGTAPGEVVLVGGGDPTLASPAAETGYPQPALLGDLARQTRTALAGTPLTRVLVDASLYSGPALAPGWKPTYVTEGAVAPVGALMVDGGRARPDRLARVADPALAAGRALASLVRPGAPVEVAAGRAPEGAAVLGEVVSQPVPQLVERMLLRSDNDLAEALARQVALAQGQPASFAGAAAAVDAVLAGLLEDVGVGADAVRLVDGSGLSRDDRIEPVALTRLLARVADGDDPRLAPVLTGLPVGGFSGTLADRYRKGDGVPAAGAVRAKTGTLNGVSALAGLVRTADGRLLAFDLAADGVPLGATRAAEAALDELAASLAACGCR